jgi:ubiquinone/menaquinone biosynthesis C-methylase UbiE
VSVLKFTEEANNLILESVQKIESDIKNVYSKQRFDEKIFKIFLSDVEHTMKFFAAQLAKARGAKIVEERDVKALFKKFWFELLRKRKTFLVYEYGVRRDLHFIRAAAKSSKTFRVLDVGCGWGRASRWFCEFLGVETEVVAVDLDILSLKYGKSLNNNFSFLRAHMSYLPFKSETFDITLSSNSFHEVESENRDRTLKEWAFCLRHSGLLYIIDSFARSHMSKWIQMLLHVIFPKMEVHPYPMEVEKCLQFSHFKVIRKSRFDFPIFTLNSFHSYIACKQATDKMIEGREN